MSVMDVATSAGESGCVGSLSTLAMARAFMARMCAVSNTSRNHTSGVLEVNEPLIE